MFYICPEWFGLCLMVFKPIQAYLRPAKGFELWLFWVQPYVSDSFGVQDSW